MRLTFSKISNAVGLSGVGLGGVFLLILVLALASLWFASA